MYNTCTKHGYYIAIFLFYFGEVEGLGAKMYSLIKKKGSSFCKTVANPLILPYAKNMIYSIQVTLHTSSPTDIMMNFKNLFLLDFSFV